MNEYRKLWLDEFIEVCDEFGYDSDEAQEYIEDRAFDEDFVLAARFFQFMDAKLLDMQEELLAEEAAEKAREARSWTKWLLGRLFFWRRSERV